MHKLRGLLPATTYHFRVHSTDASGNSTASADHTFTTAATQPPTIVTFDDLPGENQPLNGQYPAGVINWGSGTWYHSGPYGLLGTKNVGFSGPGIASGTLSLLSPRRLVSIHGHNGGDENTTVTLSCPGQATKRADLVRGEVATIITGWSGTCSNITVASTNGWDTNLDNLVLTTAGGAPQGPDGDGDGCSDAAEGQTAAGSQVSGGLRDSNYVWDFIDQFVGSPAARDRAVAAGDIGAIVFRFGATGDPSGDPLTPPPLPNGYHTSADRSGTLPGGNPWNPRPADGAISGTDIGSVVAQYGHTCA
jgi:hypothetical protein